MTDLYECSKDPFGLRVDRIIRNHDLDINRAFSSILTEPIHITESSLIREFPTESFTATIPTTKQPQNSAQFPIPHPQIPKPQIPLNPNSSLNHPKTLTNSKPHHTNPKTFPTTPNHPSQSQLQLSNQIPSIHRPA